MHWDSWHMGWMGLWWILIVPAIVAAIWFAATASRRRGESGESPEQVLKRRYANGELERDTYEQMLDELRR